MRSEKEVAKEIVQMVEWILKCDKGCASKVAGASCSYCWTLRQKIEVLEWVLNREGKKAHEDSRNKI